MANCWNNIERTKESSGNLNVFPEIEIPISSACVSSLYVCVCVCVCVCQTRWHDNRGEITLFFYIHPHQAMAAFAFYKKIFCFFGSLLVTVSACSLYWRGWGRGGLKGKAGKTPTSRGEQPHEELLICQFLRLLSSPCRVGCQMWSILALSEDLCPGIGNGRVRVWESECNCVWYLCEICEN